MRPILFDTRSFDVTLSDWRAGVLLHCCPEELDGLLRAARTDDPECFPSLLVVRNEEFLQLGKKSPVEIVNRFHLLVIVRMNRDSDQPVIRLFLTIFALLRIGYDPDDPLRRAGTQ